MSNIQNHFLFSVWSASKHTLVIVLTKDLKKCQRWKRGISLQGSGPPTTCEILHQLISHNVIKHTKKNRKSHSVAAPFSSTDPTSAGNTQLFSTATYHMSQPQVYSSIKTDFFFLTWGEFPLGCSSGLWWCGALYRQDRPPVYWEGGLQVNSISESDQACDASLSMILL